MTTNDANTQPTTPHLVDAQLVDVAATTFQMQTWSAADRCTCPMDWSPDRRGRHVDGCPYPTTTHSWVPMEHGAAPARWKPKPDAREAVQQAARWAGAVWGLGIPAMQVVEVPSGRVIWRDSARYPDAGDPVAPSWQAEVYAAAQAEHADDTARRDEQTPEPPTEPMTDPMTDPAPTGRQEVLF